MAKYGFDKLKIEFDNSGGVTLIDMSAYILNIDGVSIEAMLEESHAAGDAWVKQLWTGIRRLADIKLDGFYDDAATTGPDAIFNDVGAGGTTGGTRTLKITYGSTKTTQVETIIKSYRRDPNRNQLTKFEVVLTPTGAVTET